MEKNNNNCIGIAKRHLFWVKKMQMRHFLWDEGSSFYLFACIAWSMFYFTRNGHLISSLGSLLFVSIFFL